MLAKKVNGEKENIKRAVRILKKEIKNNEQRITRLNKIKDKKEIEILKKNKQKIKLEKKLG